MKEYQECILQEVKGVAFLSHVTILDWDESMEKMRTMLQSSQRNPALYEEGPAIAWKEWEWTLYRMLKHDVQYPNACRRYNFVGVYLKGTSM